MCAECSCWVGDYERRYRVQITAETTPYLKSLPKLRIPDELHYSWRNAAGNTKSRGGELDHLCRQPPVWTGQLSVGWKTTRFVSPNTPRSLTCSLPDA